MSSVLTANDVFYRQLAPDDFAALIPLANLVHGENYLNQAQLQRYYQLGIKDNINASWVAFIDDKLVGFRLTFAPQQWRIDQYCTTDEWTVDRQSVCYFKCNTVDESVRGLGIGSQLLAHSINSVKLQGGSAGLAHIWAESPGNSAFKYFSKCGGTLIKRHPGKWNIDCIQDGYVCGICGNRCECVALEMMVVFD